MANKLFPVCYLHIGTEKTGTTTVQSFLKENDGTLFDNGYFVPKTFRGPRANHFKLAVYGQGDQKVDDLRRGINVVGPGAVRKFRSKLESAMQEEFSAEGLKGKSLLLSNEHCHSRLVNIAEVQRIHDLLSPYCDNFKVIVYIRPQHELAISRYSTHIKLGGKRRNPLPDVDARADYYNYNRLFNRWASVFGEENIIVRLFDRGELVSGDVLQDYLSLVGIDREDIDSYKAVDKQNESLTADALEFMGIINERLAVSEIEEKSKLRKNILVNVLAEYSGKGPQVSRNDAEHFYNVFLKSNQKLCQRFFPERECLFYPDFSKYSYGEEKEQGVEVYFDMFLKIISDFGAGD